MDIELINMQKAINNLKVIRRMCSKTSIIDNYINNIEDTINNMVADGFYEANTERIPSN